MRHLVQIAGMLQIVEEAGKVTCDAFTSLNKLIALHQESRLASRNSEIGAPQVVFNSRFCSHFGVKKGKIAFNTRTLDITLDITLLCLIQDKKQGEVHPESRSVERVIVGLGICMFFSGMFSL